LMPSNSLTNTARYESFLGPLVFASILTFIN
jgi:hypothetical protein